MKAYGKYERKILDFNKSMRSKFRKKQAHRRPYNKRARAELIEELNNELGGL